MKINLRASPRKKYLILREIVVWLGEWELIAFGLGAFYLGAKGFQNSVAFFILMCVSYYISTKLGYKVLEFIVKLNSKEDNV